MRWQAVTIEFEDGKVTRTDRGSLCDDLTSLWYSENSSWEFPLLTTYCDMEGPWRDVRTNISHIPSSISWLIEPKEFFNLTHT